MRSMKKLISLLAVAALLFSLGPVCFAIDYTQVDSFPVTIVVDGVKTEGAAVNVSYRFNTYLSLRSLATAFKGTDRNFDFAYASTDYDGEYFEITTGKDYTGENGQFRKDIEEALFLASSTHRLFVDGAEKKYYTFRYGNPEDLYMSLTDILLLFDVGAEFSGENEIKFYPERTFAASIDGLDAEGYFNQFSSVLVGSAKNGKVSFSKNADVAYPVASTSKLMSYLVVKDAIKSKKIRETDLVTISAEVQKLSEAEDGRIKMTKGDTVPVSELIEAMMIISSNEAALALAEHVSGSESKFVEAMNKKASELKLEDSVFINCNGLPVMTMGSIPTKMQNRMSANDMFTLVCHILDRYPEVTDITSKQLVKLETLDYTSWNSNTLIFNNPSITGLKTGNTKASGSCVAACDSKGKVVIVLGAEDSAIRGRCAEILFRAS